MKEEILNDEKTRLDKALSVILIITIIVSIVALVLLIIVTPKQGEKFTEFYILGLGGRACVTRRK